MLIPSNRDAAEIKAAMNDLKSIASHGDYNTCLFILGSGKGSIADSSMTVDNKTIEINRKINKHILDGE